MGFAHNAFGPRSKHDKSLPYTYIAKTPAIEGDTQYYLYYFSDTICGLIEYLDDRGIAPSGVELYGVYMKEDLPLEKSYCTTRDGKWLRRPDLCRSLEARYKESMEKRYKGHVEKGDCLFDDRTRKGGGPY